MYQSVPTHASHCECIDCAIKKGIKPLCYCAQCRMERSRQYCPHGNFQSCPAISEPNFQFTNSFIQK